MLSRLFWKENTSETENTADEDLNRALSWLDAQDIFALEMLAHNLNGITPDRLLDLIDDHDGITKQEASEIIALYKEGAADQADHLSKPNGFAQAQP